jgi:hypothetical protein
MQYIRSFFILGVALFIVARCTPCGYGNGRKPCVDKFYFTVVDRANQQPQPLRFTQYELFMELGDTANGRLWAAVYPENGQLNSVRLYANPSIPDDTVYLRLDQQDIDTLLVVAEYEETNCCSKYSHISGIYYNGQLSPKDGDTFLFQK